MDVKRAKQIKRDELALGGLVLDLWRQLGADVEQRENKSVKAVKDVRIATVTNNKLLTLKQAALLL